MASKSIVNARGEILIPDPPFARFLFSSTRLAWFWLILRVYLGYTWLNSGWGKISGGVWMTGEPLKGFWTTAVGIPEGGRAPIAFDWYRNFIQLMLDQGWYTWFGPLIAWGEILIGVALILGALTGIAAFFGAFMNWNFIMAGSASSNALLFAIAILLIMGWKVAGWWGLDRWLLPWLGTPWYRVNPVANRQPPQPTP
ncbi:MAG: DoxX family membrane protein [Anaerolineales bacterium]|nr:DoxX family membrane protein [Anaerolineales bacterium]